MTKQELEAKAAELEAQLAEVKARIDALPNGVWMPKDGEAYYYYSLTVGCGYAREINADDAIDRRLFEYRPVFKTPEEALFYLDHIRAIEKLRKLAGDQSWIDWSDVNQMKYYTYYNHNENKLCGNFIYSSQYTLYYFKTDQDLNHAISQFTPEEARALFLVKE